MVSRIALVTFLACLVMATGCGAVDNEPKLKVELPPQPPKPVSENLGGALPNAEIEARLAQFESVELAPEQSKLTSGQKQLVAKLIEAAEYADRVFWEQVSPGSYDLAIELSQADDQWSKNIASLITLNYGPWDRFAGNEPFLGKKAKPPGANFYPVDLSAAKLDKYLADHPGDVASFTSPYTIIHRAGDALVSVPFSKAYQSALSKAADALEDAAELTDCPPMEAFLKSRADALESDDYYTSELLWMNTGECPLEVVYGPYEFYEDRLMGYKAAFQALIAFKDFEETKKYEELSTFADALVDDLPIPEKLMTGMVKLKTPAITIADVIYTAGDARAGFQISAFVLPNDEMVKAKKGSKNVILKNVVRAKYRKILVPLAGKLVDKSQIGSMKMEAFLNLILMWQLAHTLSPGYLTLPDGTQMDMVKKLKERYLIVDTAKSDAISLWNLFELIKQGYLPKTMGEATAVTYLATIFQTLRYSADSPHGIGKVIVYNYLAEKDALTYDPSTKRFKVDVEKVKKAIPELTEKLLTIEATGDYDAAGQLAVSYGLLPAEIKTKLADLDGLPIDIYPVYTMAASD